MPGVRDGPPALRPWRNFTDPVYCFETERATSGKTWLFQGSIPDRYQRIRGHGHPPRASWGRTSIMVAPESPRVNATAEGTPIARTDPDPRVVAFLRFCKAVDFRDVSLMRKATRELREFDIAVCVRAPRKEGGQG